MRREMLHRSVRPIRALVVVVLLAVAVPCAFGSRAKALLPIDKILDVLRNDPAMVVAIKQSIIDQASAEGRILEAAELTDPVLLRMVTDDPDITAIASDQILKHWRLQASVPHASDQRNAATEKAPEAPVNPGGGDHPQPDPGTPGTGLNVRVETRDRKKTQEQLTSALIQQDDLPTNRGTDDTQTFLGELPKNKL